MTHIVWGVFIVIFCICNTAMGIGQQNLPNQPDTLSLNYKSHELPSVEEPKDSSDFSLRFAFGLGLGFSWSNNPGENLMANFNADLKTRRLRYTLRTVRFSGDTIKHTMPSITESSFLIGSSRFPASFGVSVTNFGEYRETIYRPEGSVVISHSPGTTAGLTAGLQYIYQTDSFFGYGFYGFANLNTHAHMVGASVTIWFGPIEF